jgi:hypothetical protein
VHQINLKGPWRIEVFDKADEGFASCLSEHKVKIDSNWAATFSGARVKLHRSFNRPTGLIKSQQVCLVVIAKHIDAQIELNKQSIGRIQSDRGDVDADILKVPCLAKLEPANEISLCLAEVNQSASLTVHLEITE